MEKNPQLLELPVLFKSLVKKMTHAWKSRIGNQITMTDFRVLYVLHAEGPRKATELADAVQVTSGAVTGIADKLIDRGWLERERDEQDRRVVYLRLTPSGKEMVETLLNSQKETMNAFFNNLPEEDIEHLRRIFTNLLNKFEEEDRG